MLNNRPGESQHSEKTEVLFPVFEAVTVQRWMRSQTRVESNVSLMKLYLSLEARYLTRKLIFEKTPDPACVHVFCAEEEDLMRFDDDLDDLTKNVSLLLCVLLCLCFVFECCV